MRIAAINDSISEQKYRVLAVCPYPGLDNIIKEVAPEFPELELIYEYGELESGVEIAQQYNDGEVDAVISRGGTARLISKNIKLPTFDIGITTNDLINTLSLAKNTQSKKICLVGFYEVTRAARYLDRLLERPIPTYVTKNAAENSAMMRKLKEENVELIIGDATSVRFASAEGINNIMIASGEDSVRQCLTSVLMLFKMQHDCIELQALQRSILKNLEITYFILDSDFETLHSQVHTPDLKKISSALMQEVSGAYAKKYLAKANSARVPFEHGDHVWILDLKRDLFRDQQVVTVVWMLSSTSEKSTSSYLQDLSAAAYPFQVESLKSADPKMEQAISDCRTFAANKAPILIVGERFTGRQALAHMLYNLSSFGKGGFYSLDVAELDEEALNMLFASPRSLLCSLSLTLIVRNLQHANAEICRKFFAHLNDCGFTRRSRAIFIFDEGIDSKSSSQTQLIRYVLSSLQALLITVPSLRERQGDLMFLAAISLGEACGSSGRSCGGFTTDAEAFIKSQTWPGNLHELRGVIRQAVMAFTGEYVDRSHLERAADKWSTIYRTTERSPIVDTDILFQGSLSEIEDKIIAEVMRQEGGNKTRVTKRLGISRNTLWRKLSQKTDGDESK